MPTSPWTRRTRAATLFCVAVLGLLASGARAAAANQGATDPNGRIRFDLPAGPALDTLKLYAAQADVQLLYSVDVTQGVRTAAVKGTFTRRQAIDRMLVGTPLTATEHPTTDSWAVVRRTPPNASSLAISPDTQSNPQKTNQMPPHRKTLSRLLGFLAAMGAEHLGAQTASTTASTPDQNGETPVVMSPFDVNASTDVGYGAAATASTSRLMQNYIDVPQTVSVVTSEFLQDFNLQDVREALEYTPNVTFGLDDNASSTRLRGAIVTETYIDGVAMPAQYTAMPLDFFDRIEVVKGPSSAAFGLGQPGGLINYVSKTPQGVDATTLSFGFGEWDNYVARFDTQGVSAQNADLSYRLVGFYDSGDYETPNMEHSGAGAQLALRYNLNPTTRLDLIVAYSHTVYPSQGVYNQIWMQKTIYEAWQVTNLGGSTYLYLPGTAFSNGSVFGVSGTLPAPGTQLGILGTGDLVPKDSNANPPGWDGSTNDDFRSTLILTKDFGGGHLHLRNALTLEFTNSTTYDEGPNNVLSLPGAGNTAITTGEPTSFAGSGLPYPVGTIANASTGAPYAGVGYGLAYNAGTGTARDDEFDLLAEYEFLGGDWKTMIGGDFYDNESAGMSTLRTATTPSGTVYFADLYSSNNPTLYVSPNYTLTSNSSNHIWGDGFYAQEDVGFFHGMVDLTAGWRIDFFDSEIQNYLASTPSGVNVRPGWVSTKGAPRFAATFKPLKWLSFYGLYTDHKDPANETNKYFLNFGEYTPALQALYPPGTIESYQPGGYTVESGAKASFFDGKLYASIAVFHELTTGQINPIVVDNVVNPDGTDTQIAENEVQGLNAHGLEIELFGQVTRRLQFIADYGSVRGNYPAFSNGVPDWLDPSATISGHGKLDLGDLRGNGFYATFGGEVFSPYWIWQGAGGSLYYDSWQYLVDGGIGYRWHNGKYKQSVYFNMDNITNQVVSIGTVTPWTIEPLRQWFVTYKLSF